MGRERGDCGLFLHLIRFDIYSDQIHEYVSRGEFVTLNLEHGPRLQLVIKHVTPAL